jgi:hypothetical protein
MEVWKIYVQVKGKFLPQSMQHILMMLARIPGLNAIYGNHGANTRISCYVKHSEIFPYRSECLHPTTNGGDVLYIALDIITFIQNSKFLTLYQHFHIKFD